MSVSYSQILEFQPLAAVIDVPPYSFLVSLLGSVMQLDPYVVDGHILYFIVFENFTGNCGCLMFKWCSVIDRAPTCSLWALFRPTFVFVSSANSSKPFAFCSSNLHITYVSIFDVLSPQYLHIASMSSDLFILCFALCCIFVH